MELEFSRLTQGNYRKLYIPKLLIFELSKLFVRNYICVCKVGLVSAATNLNAEIERMFDSPMLQGKGTSCTAGSRFSTYGGVFLAWRWAVSL